MSDSAVTPADSTNTDSSAASTTVSASAADVSQNTSQYFAVVKAGQNPTKSSPSLVVGWQDYPFPRRHTKQGMVIDRTPMKSIPVVGEQWTLIPLPNMTDERWLSRCSENPVKPYLTDGEDVFPAPEGSTLVRPSAG